MEPRLIAFVEDGRCALNIVAPNGKVRSSWWAIWTGEYTIEHSILQLSSSVKAKGSLWRREKERYLHGPFNLCSVS